MAESGIDGLRIVFRFQLSFIDANEFLSFPGFFPETIVGDPIKPGRKLRFATEAADVFVGFEESFLREIISQGRVGSGELAEQTSDGGLMPFDQFRKGVVVIIDKNPGDEVCIGQRHSGRLWHPREVVGTGVDEPGLVAFQLPNQQVTSADQERDHTDGP